MFCEVNMDLEEAGEKEIGGRWKMKAGIDLGRVKVVCVPMASHRKAVQDRASCLVARIECC